MVCNIGRIDHEESAAPRSNSSKRTANMTTQDTFAVGDYVILDHSDIAASIRRTVFQVAKVARVNLHLTPVGGGQTLVAPKHFARSATAKERATAVAAAESAPAPLYLGSVVKVRDRTGLYVVISLPSSRSDHYRAAPLGGSTNNSYWSAARRCFELVDHNTVGIA
ncbi:hypothetical protein [Nocardia sp. NPDC052566]|uniref:hypothetical protein n=1 Tax=Nocardia sp. NPDC052566 TaxID=3364330 RepID=UPI0037C644A8